MLIATLTEQVELRLLELRHARQYQILVQENFERLYWLSVRPSLTEAEKRLQAGLQRLADGSGLEAGIFEGEQLLGIAGLFGIQAEFQSGEIGYWIGKQAEGRGLVTRACQALLRYGFVSLGLHRIELRCASQNQRSIGVAERLGFRLEGRLLQADRVGDAWDDFLIYGLLADEWTHGETQRAA